MSTSTHPPSEPSWTESHGVELVEFSDADPGAVVSYHHVPNAKELLQMMRARLRMLGSPIPEGYVPPPGIDLDALLKQVPWPPPA